MTDTGHLHEEIRKAETFAIQGISAFFIASIFYWVSSSFSSEIKKEKKHFFLGRNFRFISSAWR
jgi:hypothetical protein